jgi:hypothetical protein
VPSYFRKTGRAKRSGSSHLVPLVRWAAEVVRTLDRKIPHVDNANPFLFPQRRKGRKRDDDEYEIENPTAGEKMHRHRTESFLNRWLESVPGIDFSTHGGRYAFETYGEGQLGFQKSEGKIILDHMEGVEPDDVTGLYYSSDPAIARKREMMTAWINFLDHCAAEATAADPLLLDIQHLQEAVFMQKYCKKNDDRPKRRIAYCEKRRIPLWGDGSPALGKGCVNYSSNGAVQIAIIALIGSTQFIFARSQCTVSPTTVFRDRLGRQRWQISRRFRSAHRARILSSMAMPRSSIAWPSRPTSIPP